MFYIDAVLEAIDIEFFGAKNFSCNMVSIGHITYYNSVLDIKD